METNSKDNKTQVTFYISNDILELVEDTIFYLKKQMPLDKRKKITRSMFFEAAIKFALAEKKTNPFFAIIQNPENK
jgi:hypothetical protein